MVAAVMAGAAAWMRPWPQPAPAAAGATSRRRNLFDYDQVVNTQRDKIYAERRRALLAEDLAPLLVEYAERTSDDILEVRLRYSLPRCCLASVLGVARGRGRQAHCQQERRCGICALRCCGRGGAPRGPPGLPANPNGPHACCTQALPYRQQYRWQYEERRRSRAGHACCHGAAALAGWRAWPSAM
jgi:hypothetical protein